MSEQGRAGKTIRQAYSAFWLEWIILAIGLVLILMPQVITGWVEAQVGPAIFEGLPADMIIRGAGLLGVIYAVVYKIGYDLLANRYTLTDEEVIETYGIIQKNRRVTKLEHIRRVSVEIGIVGRILGFGDVLYFTAGSGGVDVRLKDIPNPEALAAEADRLARQKQSQLQEEGAGSAGSGKGGQSAQASARILDAVGSMTNESVEVQRQILQAIKSLKSETSKSNALLQALLTAQPSTSHSESGRKPEESSGGAVTSIASVAAGPNIEEAFDYPEGDDQDSGLESEPNPEPLSFDADDEPAEDQYESSPKMFGTWEDTLAPTPRSDVTPEEPEQEPEEIPERPRPVLSEPVVSDHDPETPEQDPEETSESQQDTEKSDGPFKEDDFVGLIAPGKG